MTGTTRGSNGQFRRTPASAARDMRAAELHGQGWTHERIAAELGYADRGGVTRAIDRAFTDIVTPAAEQAKRLDLERIDRLIEKNWEALERQHVAGPTAGWYAASPASSATRTALRARRGRQADPRVRGRARRRADRGAIGHDPAADRAAREDLRLRRARQVPRWKSSARTPWTQNCGAWTRNWPPVTQVIQAPPEKLRLLADKRRRVREASDPRPAWRETARPEQLLPPGNDWRVCYWQGGRGAGKNASLLQRHGRLGAVRHRRRRRIRDHRARRTPTRGPSAWKGKTGILRALGTSMAEIKDHRSRTVRGGLAHLRSGGAAQRHRHLRRLGGRGRAAGAGPQPQGCLVFRDRPVGQVGDRLEGVGELRGPRRPLPDHRGRHPEGQPQGPQADPLADPQRPRARRGDHPQAAHPRQHRQPVRGVRPRGDRRVPRHPAGTAGARRRTAR